MVSAVDFKPDHLIFFLRQFETLARLSLEVRSSYYLLLMFERDVRTEGQSSNSMLLYLVMSGKLTLFSFTSVTLQA